MELSVKALREKWRVKERSLEKDNKDAAQGERTTVVRNVGTPGGKGGAFR